MGQGGAGGVQDHKHGATVFPMPYDAAVVNVVTYMAIVEVGVIVLWML